jgi:hypothetical protein
VDHRAVLVELRHHLEGLPHKSAVRVVGLEAHRCNLSSVTLEILWPLPLVLVERRLL